MNLTVDIQRPFTEEWKQQVIKLINKAIGSVENVTNEEDRHDAVHTARKCFKKIRAALRLIRDESDFYKEQNVFFRDLGRKVSDVRDATSMISTVENLRQHYNSKLYKNSFTELETAIIAYREDLSQKLWEDGDLLKDIVEKLKVKKAEVPVWSLSIKHFSEIKPSIKRVYKRGKHRLADCENSGASEDFHQWRKRAKYMRYILRMLYDAWPAVLKPLEDELHQITDLVGDEHDIHVLKAWVSKHDFLFSQQDEHELFEAICLHRQKNLRARVLLLGKRWYLQGPSAFTNHMQHYWEIGKKLHN